MAATEKFKGRDGEKRERTTWFRCVAWGQAAEFAAQYLRKGDAVFVQGSIEERSWEDKDGQKRTVWEVRVSRVNSLMPRGGSRTSKPEDGVGDEDVADEAIPF